MMDELKIVRLVDGAEYIGLIERNDNSILIDNPLVVTSGPRGEGMVLVNPLILSEDSVIEISNRNVLYVYTPCARTSKYYINAYRYYVSNEYRAVMHEQMDKVISSFDVNPTKNN